MKDLDFSKIDLITENAKLKLELLKYELNPKHQKVEIVNRRVLSISIPSPDENSAQLLADAYRQRQEIDLSGIAQQSYLSAMQRNYRDGLVIGSGWL